MTAERTAALQAVMAGNAHVALIAVVHALALPLFYPYASDETCLTLRLDRAALRSGKDNAEGSEAVTVMTGCAAAWRERLPQEASALWDWLMSQDSATRLDLLAYCAANAVNAVKRPHEREESGRFVHAGQFASTLRLNMAQWWQPTADNYLAHVSKARVLEAVREGVSPSAAENLATIKTKAALVTEAEQRLSGTGWLPMHLRSVSVETDIAEAAA